MKYIVLIAILFINILFALENEKLKVVFPKDFPPSYVYKNGKTSGYAIELFKEIEKDLNLNVEYIPKNDWPEIVNQMKLGLVDIIPNQGITEDRKNYMEFSVPIEHIKISIFQKSNKGFYVKSVNDILDKNVAVVRNNVCAKIFKKYKNIKTTLYEDKNSAFEAFKNGKTELLCYPEEAVEEYIKENSLGKKIQKSFEIFNINRAIGVCKKNGKLVKDINESLEKLRKNGKLEAIYKKWHKEEKKYPLSEIFKTIALLSIMPTLLIFYLKYKKVILTRKELEDEVKEKTKLLQESKNKFEFVVERALGGFWEWNLDTDEIICSDKWYETVNLNKNEFVLTIENIRELIHKDDREKNKEIIDRLLDGQDLGYSNELRVKKGRDKYIWVYALGTVFENHKSEKVFFGLIMDIDDNKKLEEQKRNQDTLILHQSKMASMGEMLENIAHQWRQPLSMISTSATGVELQKEMNILEDDYLIESMKNINDATQYLSTTIDDFRNYFSSHKNIEEVNISRSIEKVVRLLSSKFKNSEINLIINCENLKIMNLENELIQVIINILNNARDAFENKDLTKKLIFIESYKEEDEFIIQIKDNAGGIKEDIINKVFEPYFTTKYNSNGTGLGLFMCLEILNKHMDGNIKVENVEFEYENEVHKGAMFTIKLKNL